MEAKKSAAEPAAKGAGQEQAEQAAAKVVVELLQKKPPVPAKLGELKDADGKYNRYFIAAPAGCTPEELSGNAVFWQLLISATADNGEPLLREYDDIKVVAADDSWQAIFSVCRNRTVKLWPGAVMEMPSSGANVKLRELPKPYVFRYSGPRDEHRGVWIENEETGQRYFSSGGVPWKTEEDAFREFMDSAVIRGPDAVRYQTW